MEKFYATFLLIKFDERKEIIISIIIIITTTEIEDNVLENDDNIFYRNI